MRNAAPKMDPPDPERVFRNYVAQCRRLGIKPVQRERAKAAIQEWADALAAARAAPAVTALGGGEGRGEAGEPT